MARFESGDEVRLRIGSLERLVTIAREVDNSGPGVFELLTPGGQRMTVHESILRSKQKPILNVFSDKAREHAIRQVYEAITKKSGQPGHGPADLILKFLR